MTEQKKRFADKYFETLNGSQSAIYAGYSESTSRQIAYNLLQEPEVEEYLSKLREEYQRKTGVTKEAWLNELKAIGFSDIRKLLTADGGLRNVNDIDDETAKAIAGIESFDVEVEGMKMGTNRKIKMYDKLNALEKIGRHLGYFEKDNEQLKSQTQNIINLGSGVKPDEAT